MKIIDLNARQIYDSRGNPTIEVELFLDGLKPSAKASVPSGASKGKNEAMELRDKDGRVLTAVNIVNSVIKDAVVGRSFSSFVELDKFLLKLDGTENKSNLGANSILGVSIAGARAMAMKNRMPLFRSFLPEVSDYLLPLPLMNLINGGAHSNNGIATQEFMIIPKKFNSFADSIWAASKVFHALKSLLVKKSFSTAVGDEGGFAANINNEKEALDLLIQSIELAGYRPGEDIFIALDFAANEFYRDGHYYISGHKLNSAEMIDFITDLYKKYPISSIEDPLAEEDRSAWRLLTERLGGSLQIVGDDIFVTNSKYLKTSIDEKIGNSILIKPNQIGTLFETIETINLANQFDYTSIISHRSGETEDVTISHLAVGLGTGQIKTGSICRSERVAKYNELIRIEEKLGNNSRFAGKII
jgi:enolase